MSVFSLRVLVVLLFLAATGVIVTASEQGDYTVKSIAVINSDERGVKLNYPRSIFYDRVADETYVLGSGERELVIFTADFYPVISVGHGRGLMGVASCYAYQEQLFFCLGGSSENPGLIALYDRALLPEGELELKGFDEVDTFKPEQVVFSNGFFYVVGTGSHGLLKFDQEGVFVERIIPRAEVLGIEEDASVKFFAVDSKGQFFLLSEELGQIFVYSEKGKFIYKFGTKGGSSGKLSRPRALALNEELGLVFVVDYMRHAVNVYSIQGDYLFEFGGKGVGRGWLSFPSSIATDKRGRLWVADTFNGRVQVFSIERRGLSLLEESVEPEAENPVVGTSGIPVVKIESEKLEAEKTLPESSSVSVPESAPDLQSESELAEDEVQESDL